MADTPKITPIDDIKKAIETLTEAGHQGTELTNIFGGLTSLVKTFGTDSILAFSEAKDAFSQLLDKMQSGKLADVFSNISKKALEFGDAATVGLKQGSGEIKDLTDASDRLLATMTKLSGGMNWKPMFDGLGNVGPTLTTTTGSIKGFTECC